MGHIYFKAITLFLKGGERVLIRHLNLKLSHVGSLYTEGNGEKQNCVKLLISCLVKFHESLQKFTSLLQGKI